MLSISKFRARIDRQDRRHDGQELGRDEEEQHVAPLRRAGSRARRRRGSRAASRSASTSTITARSANASPKDSRPPALSMHLAVAVEVGVKNSFGAVFASCSSLKELRTIQNTGEEEQQRDQPGQRAERPVDPRALADDSGLRLVAAHADVLPLRSPTGLGARPWRWRSTPRRRRCCTTTTPGRPHPPPIDFWNVGVGRPGPPPVITAMWS